MASLTNLTAITPGADPNADFVEVVNAGPYTYYARGTSPLAGLFRTDGTPASTTQLLANIPQFSNAGMFNFIPYNNDIVFCTFRPVGINNGFGGQLYRTLAPAAGVSLLADFSTLGSVSAPVAAGNAVFFTGETPVTFHQQYITDGTAATTRIVAPINLAAPLTSPTTLQKAGPYIYFNSSPGAAADLLRTDGSQAGTVRLDNYSNTFGSAGLLTGSADLNGSLYFRGTRSNVGLELWKSDGSIGGTVMAVDCVPGVNNSSPTNFATIGSSLFFAGAPSATSTQSVPYISDGSPAGTRAVTGVCINPRNFTGVGEAAVFVASAPGGSPNIGEELFRSDGTVAGTSLLRDVLPGPNTSDPRDLVRLGSHVYFSATDGVHGRELWRTDGATAGTTLFRDLCIGDIGSDPKNLVVAGDRLYFTAYTPETGTELWSTDGSLTGTLLLFDLIPGPSSPNIGSITRAGNRLYFLATVAPAQRALWSFDWAGGLSAGFICTANYNRVAGLTVGDLFDYLADWFAGASRADINGSGALEVQDIFDYLSLWFVGC